MSNEEIPPDRLEQLLEQRMQEASELADLGEWQEAFDVLRDAEADAPHDATLLCALGRVALELESEDLAYDYFRRCLDAQPEDPAVLVLAGTALARYDDPAAEGALRLAALAAPDLAEARLAYGAYLSREGLLELALEELTAAQRAEPDDPRILRELGTALLLAGRAMDGAAELERAAAAAPDDPELRLLLGLALLGAGRVEDGAEEVHTAARELPDDGDAQLVAALASASQEWMDEAWQALARAEEAAGAPASDLLREVEEAVEGGPEAAEAFLQEHLAPSLLRERLSERP